MYVLAFEDGNVESPEPDNYESVHDFNFLVRPCQHCTDAPCEKVCPTTARHTRDRGGLVLTDYEVCIGCRYCQVACPYGVNYFQWGTGRGTGGAQRGGCLRLPRPACQPARSPRRHVEVRL